MKNSWWPPSLKIFHKPADQLHNQPSPNETIPVLFNVALRLFSLQVSFANEFTTLEGLSVPFKVQKPHQTRRRVHHPAGRTFPSRMVSEGDVPSKANGEEW